jgi:hypothetical protein
VDVQPGAQKECWAPDEALLRKKGIDPHDFKRTWKAKPPSRFDICFCKDGAVVIRAHGQCGKSVDGIPTDLDWKK